MVLPCMMLFLLAGVALTNSRPMDTASGLDSFGLGAFSSNSNEILPETEKLTDFAVEPSENDGQPQAEMLRDEKGEVSRREVPENGPEENSEKQPKFGKEVVIPTNFPKPEGYDILKHMEEVDKKEKLLEERAEFYRVQEQYERTSTKYWALWLLFTKFKG